MTAIVFLLELLILADIKSSGIDPVDNLTVCFFIVGVFVSFVFDISKSRRFRHVRLPLVIGFSFRLALLFFDRYGQGIYQLPNSGADSETFYFNAKWQALGMPSRRTGSFISLFRDIFRIIGTNRLFGQFIIVMFSVVALCATAYILSELDLNMKQRFKTMMLVSLLPNFAVLGAIFLRESIVSMFTTLSLLFFVRYLKGKSVINVLLSAGFLLFGSIYHSGIIGLAIGYILVVLLFNRKKQKNTLSFGRIITAGFLGIGLLYLYINYNDTMFSKISGIDDLSDIANISQLGRTNYSRYVGNSNSIWNVMIFTIPRVLFFLFSPFPWQWGTTADLIGFFFSGLYYLLVLLHTCRFLIHRKGNERTFVFNLLLVTMCFVFVFAWGVVNSGTACRHREKGATLFAVLYALTLPTGRSRPNLDGARLKL